jgi:hypothetical protein
VPGLIARDEAVLARYAGESAVGTAAALAIERKLVLTAAAHNVQEDFKSVEGGS